MLVALVAQRLVSNVIFQLLVVGRCYNLQLRWSSSGASLFVTLWVVGSTAHDVASSVDATHSARLQVSMDGFACPISPLWLDPRRHTGSESPSTSTLQLLHTAEMVVCVRLMSKEAVDGVVSPRLVNSVDTEGAGDPHQYFRLPLHSVDIGRESTVLDASTWPDLANDAANPSVLQSLTQVTAPALCTPNQPQWNEAVDFVVRDSPMESGVEVWLCKEIAF